MYIIFLFRPTFVDYLTWTRKGKLQILTDFKSIGPGDTVPNDPGPTRSEE